MPTKKQLQNRLKPQPTNVNIAGQGLFRGVGNESAIFFRQGDKVKQLDLVGTFIPSNKERAALGNFGNQVGQAQQRLLDQTGINFQSLPKFNIADLRQSRGSAGQRLGAISGNFGGGSLDEFLNLTRAGGTQQQVNTQQNIVKPQPLPNLTNEQQTRFNELVSAGAPQDVALNAVNQITPKTIEDGIKNLGTPLSNPSVVDFLNVTGQPSDFTSRARLAKQAGIANYRGTAEQNTQLLGILRQQQRPQQPQNTRTTPTITTDTSKDASPIEIATSTGDTTRADATAAGADTTSKSIQDFITMLTPPESEESKGVQTLIDTINTELEGLKGRGEAQLSAEEEQGVQLKKQALQNAKTELDQKLAEYKAIQAKYEQLNTVIEDKPITMGSIRGQQAQVNRAMRAELNVKASEIAMIQANVASAQGNLELAQEAANRAVDLKYEDAKDAIDIRLQQLELLQGQLTKKEEIRAQAVELFLNQQQDALDFQRGLEEDKNRTLLNLMRNYPDAGITLKDTIESANRKISGSTPTSDTPTNIFDAVSTTTTKDLKTQLKEKFDTAFANKVILELNDEQLREFMRDFEATQNELGQSLDPEIFLKEWKAEVGIETGSKREI